MTDIDTPAVNIETTPVVGFPVNYITGKSDPGKPGTVCSATVCGIEDDGNLRLMVVFPHAIEGRQHIPHKSVDLSNVTSFGGNKLPYNGGTWSAIKGE